MPLRLLQGQLEIISPGNGVVVKGKENQISLFGLYPVGWRIDLMRRDIRASRSPKLQEQNQQGKTTRLPIYHGRLLKLGFLPALARLDPDGVSQDQHGPCTMLDYLHPHIGAGGGQGNFQ